MMKKTLFASGLFFLIGLIIGRLRCSTINSADDHEDISHTGANADEMYIKMGARRFVLHFSSLLPQVHLTLISILQGVALGVLIEQLDYQSIQLFTLPLYIASLIITALIWHQYAMAFIAFVWPFWGWHTLLQFFLAACEIFAFAAISKPAIWMLGISFTAFTGAIIRKMNTKIVTPDNYERNEEYMSDIVIEKRAAKQLFWTGMSILIGGVLRHVIEMQQGYCLQLIDLSIGIVITLLAIWLLTMADKETSEQLKTAFEGSPWLFENYQVIERESQLRQDRKHNSAG